MLQTTGRFPANPPAGHFIGGRDDADPVLYHWKLYPPHRQCGGPDRVPHLTEYRRRLAQAQQEPEETEENLVLLPRESAPSPRRTRARRARRRALFLDACASMGVVVMTLTFTLRVLAL